MKVTAAIANKTVKELQERIAHLYKIQERDKTYASVPGMVDIVPDYNFSSTQIAITALESQVRDIKHSINEFNTTTVLNLPDSPTIDKALIELAQLNKRLQVLDAMRSMPPKKLEDNSMFGRQSAPQYKVTTFNPADAEEVYCQVHDRIRDLQMQLDIVNNTIVFECSGL